jgi:L-lysine 2,3-aminomutase
VLSNGHCADCGLQDPKVLEFDHVGGKRANVSTLVHEGYSTRRIAQEIECCEVVCVNCHRRRTARRGLSWRLSPAQVAAEAWAPRRRNFLFLLKILQHACCLDCGEADIVVLEFDHVGPKRDCVVNLAAGGYSLRTLQHEVEQCEIRCANCHRRRTFETFGGFRNHLSQPP